MIVYDLPDARNLMRPRQSLVARVILISLAVFWLPMTLGIASPLFPNQVYPIGPSAGTILVADFNNDGIQDFAVTASIQNNVDPIFPPNGWVGVFLGKTDGSFAVTWGVDLGHSPVALAVGDFNGDGILDIVSADSDTNQLYALL